MPAAAMRAGEALGNKLVGFLFKPDIRAELAAMVSSVQMGLPQSLQ